MNILDDLKWRGAINQETDHDGLYELVNDKSVGIYVGIDPTGDSMHIGHLILHDLETIPISRSQTSNRDRWGGNWFNW